ncbi:F-box/LRR-repeat protein [Thalictrum thalictroides]|uniref:F-box/LRR-repeat protein n=1 Tax=Thalictrum thalictroides TaxID=46969 RepID=A0A7J6XAZ0_THATH|nr:F-box/LRR-repeat protein [Thalictrum thalictroides]
MQQQQQEEDSNEIDRISCLPDAIIHQIYSTLDTKQIFQASILSNRWRYLWKSIHTLHFNLDNYTTIDQIRRNDFVDQILFLRDEIDVEKFTFSCHGELNAARLYIWLIFILRFHVQEIILDLNLFEPFEFPEEIFGSDVKVLSLNRMGMYGIQMPSLMCNAGMIRSLELISVKFPYGDDDGELVLNCGVLKNLVLINCVISHLYMLTISPPLLENLEFRDEFDGVGYCKVKICTPCLKSVKYVGPMFDDILVEKLSSLESADLDVYRIRYYAIEKEMYAQRLMNVLTGIYNTRTLTLSLSLLKTLTKLPDIIEKLPNLLRNLKCMNLTNQWDDETCICPVASILERLPHIESLVWERTKTRHFQGDLSKRHDSCICAILEKLPPVQAHLWERKKVTWLGSTNTLDISGESLPKQYVFHCLKTIKIRNPREFGSEIKIMEFLLKRAIALKEIIISTTEEQSRDEKMLAEFCELLSELPRASSSVLIHFQ